MDEEAHFLEKIKRFASLDDWESVYKLHLQSVQMAAKRSRLKTIQRGRSNRAKGDGIDAILLLAQQAFSQLHRAADKSLLERLDAEREGIIAALESTTGVRRLRLATAIWRFWLARGYYQEGYDWLILALRTAKNAPPAMRAEGYRGAGVLAGQLAKDEDSRSYLNRSLALYRTLQLPVGEAECLNHLGALALRNHKIETASSFYHRSLMIWQDIGDLWGMATAYNNIGTVSIMQEDFASATTYLNLAAELYRLEGDEGNLTKVLVNQGALANRQHDYVTASIVYARALPMIRRNGNPLALLFALHNLGDSLVRAGEPDAGISMLLESLSLREQTGYLSAIGYTFWSFALISRSRNDMQRAVTLLGAVEAIGHLYGPVMTGEDAFMYEQDLINVRGCMEAEEFQSALSAGLNFTLQDVFSCIDLFWNDPRRI